jgi:hypothetical protein
VQNRCKIVRKEGKEQNRTEQRKAAKVGREGRTEQPDPDSPTQPDPDARQIKALYIRMVVSFLHYYANYLIYYKQITQQASSLPSN